MTTIADRQGLILEILIEERAQRTQRAPGVGLTFPRSLYRACVKLNHGKHERDILARFGQVLGAIASCSEGKVGPEFIDQTIKALQARESIHV